MTPGGRDLGRLTAYAGADESPDWQAIPAPRTDARCGDLAPTGTGTYDLRRAGGGLSCAQARALVRRWLRARRPRHVGGYSASVKDFGGTARVQLRRDGDGRRRLVAFLYQRSGR
jgi:hypothetical protein